MSFYRDTIRKARKEHKCCLCQGIINIGDDYHEKAGTNYDGDFFNTKECEACQPVIAEFMKSDYGDEGYCKDWIQDWWRDVKCYDCKNRWPLCKPILECNIENLTDCRDYKDGYCLGGDTCDDMTHYCRCEKYEEADRKYI